MTRRICLLMLATTALIAAVASSALAKGPESVAITGPGIDDPVELTGQGDGDLVRRLMEQTGLWFGVPERARLVAPPSVELGPAHILTWVNSGPPGDPVADRTIRQLLYVQAEGGPVIRTPAQDALDGWGGNVVGWFVAPEDLVETLAALGDPMATSGADRGMTTREAETPAPPAPTGAATDPESVYATGGPPETGAWAVGDRDDHASASVALPWGFAVALGIAAAMVSAATIRWTAAARRPGR